ncbi:hypothetical protein PLEOSDRAFT_1090971 [Pleurotus ostreatus PC15]|uniref:Phospholipase C/P1 nuclease n=1 Tax=Pleurotus ostreatus (strain PC15) TaxID=1137138 RepID=A0A067NEA8_PLEO1|nr:hypothetical protein PLEOSDRAFT_1090971 [Pleurotus ostreatus PC15]
MHWRAPLLAALAVSGIPTVYGWGAAGHEIVATIAQIHLHPTVLPKICTILNFTSTNPDEPQCHLAPIATWADRIRFKMRWSAGLHYIGAVGDHPQDTCLYPGERGWAGHPGGNVLGGIRNTTGILRDWVAQGDGTYNDTANEALKFLVHFLGDMHMPLHLTGRDRGGNSVKVTFDGRQTNLHSAWDSLLVAKAVRTVPAKYNHPLPNRQIEYNLRGAIYDSFVRKVMWEGVLGKWHGDVEEWLACPAPSSPPIKYMLPHWAQVAFGGRAGRVARLAQRVFGHAYFSIGAPEMFDDGVLCPYHWSQPIHALNCRLVWPKEIDEPPYSHAASAEGERTPRVPLLELDTPKYAGVVEKEWILEELMAQAGLRLAGVLNWLFMDPVEGESGLTVNL